MAASLPGLDTLTEGTTLNLTTPSGNYTGTLITVADGYLTLNHFGHTFNVVLSKTTGHWYAGEGGPGCQVIWATAQ